MKIKKADLERYITEELEKILSENAEDSVKSAENAFENLLTDANLNFFYRDGKFYLTLPYVDLKNKDKDPELRQQSTIIIDVLGFGSSEIDTDI